MSENKNNSSPAMEKIIAFLKKNWPETLKPITVLTVICLVTSLLLAVTNEITAPIIEVNAKKAADALRKELLPAADSFELVEMNVENITEAYKATNDEGYIITSFAKGYNGEVPVMVAFDTEHNICAVKFLENNETPGLGKKVNTKKFENQFAGKESEELALSDIDAIASATITSSAAVNAINTAINAYNENVKGEIEVELTPEERRAVLLPDAGAITKIDAAIENVTEAYKGEKYGYIIYTEGPGFYKKPIYAAVAFDDEGVITGVWIDGSNETDGVGTQIGKAKFAKQFIGKKDLGDVPPVAGATVSSDKAKEVVQKAIDAFLKVKGA